MGGERERLAAALGPHACIVTSGGMRCDCGWKWQGGATWTSHRWDDPEPARVWREHLADTVLPVVQALVAEAQAEALEAFRARLATGAPSVVAWIRSLDDRIAALRATTSGEGL